MKEELEKLIKENFYDDHENCDDSCGKKADYTELITSIINLVDEEVMDIIDQQTFQMLLQLSNTEYLNGGYIDAVSLKDTLRAKLKGVSNENFNT